ncbi:hypothetical protein FH972_021962 [Carpinus fangiana]|uniref:Alpha/beta hydrolase fold-3 domain-containing protein n=1 Tax=Carpinus fangiana TaxID=176857 RepID=A0A5N6KRD8_9ROSI|nr:hypothetical protein FH972_021962 [Carpinus fangiana]
MTTQPAIGRPNVPRAEAEPTKAPGLRPEPRIHDDLEMQMQPLHGPRWALYIQARIWRFLMAIGMALHRMAPPRPPKLAFSRVIPTTISPTQGSVSILFFVPKGYEERKRAGGPRYPVVVNFHGGGFTLGNATDDARWAGAVTEQVDAVVACVEYRRAPEHPFPTAVEDGVDAIIYIARHAQELHLNPERIAVSGFSSGGNMALTVPLRLQEELFLDQALANAPTSSTAQEATPVSPVKAPIVSVQNAAASDDDDSPTAPPRHATTPQTAQQVARLLHTIRIVAICAWYPSTDYTRTREERRATNVRKDQELSAVFTRLFDASYLQPPTLNMGNPYLSPGVASDALLAALPQHVILYTCEWDMLLDEGKRMRERLERVGKTVAYTMVEGVPHGWDRAPNPLRQDASVERHYRECCAKLRELLWDDRGMAGGPEDAKIGVCAMPEPAPGPGEMGQAVVGEKVARDEEEGHGEKQRGKEGACVLDLAQAPLPPLSSFMPMTGPGAAGCSSCSRLLLARLSGVCPSRVASLEVWVRQNLTGLDARRHTLADIAVARVGYFICSVTLSRRACCVCPSFASRLATVRPCNS